jgi:PAS domain S-box-containing protein
MINKEDEFLKNGTQEKNRYVNVTPFFLITLSLLSLGILIISFFRIQNDLTEQRKMKARLSIQNETFMHAEESAEQGTYGLNEQTRKLTFSDNFYRLLDTEPNSFTTLDAFLDYIHPDDKPFVQRVAKEAYKRKHQLDIRFRVYTKNGNLKYVRATGKTVASDGVNMMVGTLQDVTDDTLLNEELKRREQQLRQAHLLGKIGVWETDFITKKTTWSNELYHIFGYKRGEINVSETDARYIHPEDMHEINKAVQKARETGEPFEVEYRRFDKHGKLRYVVSKSEVKKDDAGNVIGLFGVIMDITQLREKEWELRESELFSKKIIELLPNIIYVFDLDERKDLFIAGNISSIISYDPENTYNTDDIMNELIHYGDYDKIKIHHANLRKAHDNEIHEIEYRFLFKNGRWIYMLSRDMVFKRNKKGEVTQIIGVAMDITELKRSNENLKSLNNILVKKNDELEQLNEELSSFSYVASHDLQEPLRKIRTFTNLITEKDAEKLSPAAKEYFGRITAAVTRMQKLIEALLSYSRTNISEANYELTDLNKLVEETKNDLNEMIKEKNVIIESCKLPALKILPLQFHQLFLNIVGNAIKYSKPNVPPHIKITAELIDGTDIAKLGAQTQHRYWKLSFMDNGIGFEQQYENKIFELFQRLHGKNEYPGTGIGLAICKKIVQNHSGFITATGKSGMGSTFNIYIPE